MTTPSAFPDSSCGYPLHPCRSSCCRILSTGVQIVQKVTAEQGKESLCTPYCIYIQQVSQYFPRTSFSHCHRSLIAIFDLWSCPGSDQIIVKVISHHQRLNYMHHNDSFLFLALLLCPFLLPFICTDHFLVIFSTKSRTAHWRPICPRRGPQTHNACQPQPNGQEKGSISATLQTASARILIHADCVSSKLRLELSVDSFVAQSFGRDPYSVHPPSIIRERSPLMAWP